MKKNLLSMLIGGMVLALPMSAHAISLTGMSIDDFCAGYDCFNDVTEDVFDFEEFNSDPSIGDGVVASGWAASNDASTAGTYLYAYAIGVDPDSSDDVHGLSVTFPGLVGDDVRYINEESGIAPSFATASAGGWGVYFFDPALTADTYSVVFGAISTYAPTTSMVNMIDNGSEGHFPEVFTPSGAKAVPEPGTVLLMGIGLIGLALVGLRRERSS